MAQEDQQHGRTTEQVSQTPPLLVLMFRQRLTIDAWRVTHVLSLRQIYKYVETVLRFLRWLNTFRGGPPR